jgi:hypothetical protein
VGGRELREAQPSGDFRAAGSTRSAAIVAQKRQEQATLWPLRRFALLPSGTMPHRCQSVFATPLPQRPFRYASITAGGQDIILKVL